MQRQTSRAFIPAQDSSLTGTFEISLTRAVLPYREVSEWFASGGRIHDIGLGVVMDGTDPARADVLDLGSADVKVVDLSGPLVVLGWLYPSGLRSLSRVVSDSGVEDLDRARAFTFGMAMRALQAAGFGPLTRPTILRIGFRDLCRDLDLHESTALRLVLPTGGVARLFLDYESVTLMVRAAGPNRDLDLEIAVSDAFPGRQLLRSTARDLVGAQAYHVPLPIPRSLGDARDLLATIRKGFVHLLARFDPDRYRSISELTGTFGERDSLRGMHDDLDRPTLETVVVGRRVVSGLRDVH